MTELSGIVDFIRARLDETETAAKAATPGPWIAERHHTWVDVAPDIIDTESGANVPSSEDAEHIALHDPSRTLREVAAHRALLDAYDTANSRSISADAWLLLHGAVVALAGIWRDHPSWRSEWNVTE